MEFNVSIAQINPKTGDLEGNTALIIESIRNARQHDADLVVFPEMCLTGYCLDEKLLINREFLSEHKRRIVQEIAPKTDRAIPDSDCLCQYGRCGR